jgi:squalene-hopene/tetraprenyl-beta-curcumene cyclase
VSDIHSLDQGDLPVHSSLRNACLATLAAVLLTAPARAADAGVPSKEVKPVVEKGYAFLKARQGGDGSFSGKVPGQGPGITALVVAALLRNGYGPDDPVVAGGLKYLEGQVKKDGGIYDRGLANYVTSVAVMALSEANQGGKYDTVIKNATKFLKGLQFDGDDKDAKHGGVGYGNGARDRPDLSNTQLFLDALLAAGVPKTDPAVQRALKFISRCQNLPGESNDQAFARKTSEDDKGGLTYRPDPDDKPHQTAAGGLRSLGGMTYAGLKSFLYAGVGKDDPRVKGAINWIRRHYTLKENPGMGTSGLYYYYHTFAKAMTAWGEDQFADDKGAKHDWRRELFDELKGRQRPEGNWINARNDQFGEGNPDLATAFALLALSYTQAPKK